jgi:hypothetical protein
MAITGDSIQSRSDPPIDLSKLTEVEKDALILSLLPRVGNWTRRARGLPLNSLATVRGWMKGCSISSSSK